LFYSVVTSSRGHHRVGSWAYEANNPTRFNHHLSSCSSPDLTYPEDRRVETPIIIVRNKQLLKPPRYVQCYYLFYILLIIIMYIFYKYIFISYIINYTVNPGVVVRIVLVHPRALVRLQVILGQVVHVVHLHHLALHHSCHAALVQAPHYPTSLLQAIGINDYYILIM